MTMECLVNDNLSTTGKGSERPFTVSPKRLLRRCANLDIVWQHSRANCARATAANAIEDLQKLGWVKVARVGKMRGNKATRACAYYLTLYPEDISIPATHDYRTWRIIQRPGCLHSTVHIVAVLHIFPATS
jgi:hypothetical protein